MTSRYEEELVYYPGDVARYDILSRHKKAQKIQQILHDYQRTNPASIIFGKCLDIGCGPGIISAGLASEFDTVIAIDLDRQAIRYGQRHHETSNLIFSLGDVGRLPLPDEAFDVVICAQVYEHVLDPELLAAEIWRVLKPGGCCFFSGPNRLALMEEHYFLPFLSWLPRPMANAYVRLTKRGAFYDAAPWYLWQIKKLWRRFQCYDYSFELIRRPHHFAMGDGLKKWSWVADLPPILLNLLVIFLPNYNWMLRKPPITVRTPTQVEA